MNRLVAVSLTALLCAGCQGCQSPRQPVDPFLGRTTVPPPPTGVIGPAGSIPPDSGGFLQRAPATNPATNNQFTPPESDNNLVAPPGINNSIPVGGYPGYQTSAPVPQNNRWARANPNRSSSTPATSPTAAASGNIQLTSGTEPWQPAQPDAQAASPVATSPGSAPVSPVSQIRIVPSSSPTTGGNPASDPTDIMNLPPKSTSPAADPATM